MYYQADTISKAILSVILQCLIAHIYCKCFHCFFFSFLPGFIATLVWLVGIALGTLKLLPIYGILDLKYNIVAYSVLIALSLLLICFLYLSIRKRSCNRNAALDTGNHQKSVEENTKLIKTLFIVICASVTLWAPSMALCNWSVSGSGFNCELDFLHVSPNQFSY